MPSPTYGAPFLAMIDPGEAIAGTNRIYQINTAELTNPEAEGSDAAVSVDMTRKMPCMIIGSISPTLTDILIVHNIDGRLVARYRKRSGLGCGSINLPNRAINLAWTYKRTSASVPTTIGVVMVNSSANPKKWDSGAILQPGFTDTTNNWHQFTIECVLNQWWLFSSYDSIAGQGMSYTMGYPVAMADPKDVSPLNIVFNIVWTGNILYGGAGTDPANPGVTVETTDPNDNGYVNVDVKMVLS